MPGRTAACRAKPPPACLGNLLRAPLGLPVKFTTTHQKMNSFALYDFFLYYYGASKRVYVKRDPFGANAVRIFGLDTSQCRQNRGTETAARSGLLRQRLHQCVGVVA